MSKSVTKPNKLHKGELAYLNVFTLRFLGKTFEEIGQATGYSPAYLRQLFMKGGKLHDPWKEFELKAREVSIDETYTVLFAELPNVVRAMIQNSKLPFDMSAVVAGKTLMEYGLGKPEEKLKLSGTVGIVNFSDWAMAQAEELKQNDRTSETTIALPEEPQSVSESSVA